jgi:hypothetical protein
MKYSKVILSFIFIAALALTALAQDQRVIKRTTFKEDRLSFGVGGTISLIGAPHGSVRIEGWNEREVEISAEIEVQADSEADLERIAKVTGFVMDESLGRLSIVTVGPHDKKAVRKLDKRFPKQLYGSPFRVNYVLRVPQYTDLVIDGGVGDLHISGVEGTLRVNFLDTNADIALVGGGLLANFGKGSVNIAIPTHSWRGRFADVQLASGDLALRLPRGLNADFDATILRSGKIENGFEGFTPRVRKAVFTDISISAKAGAGSIPLKFTVGDGNIVITQFTPGG